MPDTIAIIGNCQIPGVAACLEALSPTVKIDQFHLNKLCTEGQRLGAVENLRKYDLVLSHNLTHARFGPLKRAALEQQISKIVFFPQIFFHGFHPDDAPLRHEGKSLASPLGSHHSLLLAAAYMCEIPPERAVRLFNSYIFACLGYFDEYEVAKSVLLSHASELGFDLSACLVDWQSSGPFMYIPRHPMLRVISDLSIMVAKKAGIPISGSIPDMEDRLSSNVILPVYPALAKRLGLTGSTTFKLSKRQASGVNAKNMRLEQFAKKCFRIYATYPKKVFSDDRFAKVRKILREECGYFGKRTRVGPPAGN
jgi:Polysaccharide biosynthesis enzyme WcbI